MNTLPLAVLALALAPVAAQAALAKNPVSQSPEVAPGTVLVRFEHDSSGLQPAVLANGSKLLAGDAPATQALKARLGLQRQQLMLDGDIEQLQLPSYLRVEDAIAQLQADPNVRWVQPNYLKRKHEVIPNDTRFAEQWALKNTGQADNAGAGTAGADLASTFAWDADNNGTADRTDASSVKLAVVDDGFQLNHSDLAGNFITGRDFLADGREDADASPGSASDTHGTLVAGAAGAVGNNGVGIAAPLWRVQLMPLRFAYDTATEVRALDYARQQGARVVNASFGAPQLNNAERDAIQRLRDADIVLVASAGNLDSNTDHAIAAYPANFDLENVISVAAHDRRDRLADFSQYGPTTVDVAAPGQRVLTTAVNNTYQSISGTSFSAPYTAAVAALIRAVYPSADANEVKARLIEGAQAGANAMNRLTVGGRVNADAALDLSARPSIVINTLRLDDSASGDNDQAADPGEQLDLVVTFKNLWQNASGLNVALESDSSRIAANGANNLAISSLPKGATTSLRFPVRISADAAHEVAVLRFRISGAGYSAVRHFNVQLGKLSNRVTTNASFSSSPQDEFHTYQFDLPATANGYRSLTLTSGATQDIDLLIKRSTPPQYEISLGVDPESGEQTFFTDAPSSQIGGEASGNENVVIDSPLAGTWFVTVVNYDQGSLPYSLSFNAVENTPGSGSSGGGSSSGGSSGGGGGAFAAFGLLGLALLRRRKLPV